MVTVFTDSVQRLPDCFLLPQSGTREYIDSQVVLSGQILFLFSRHGAYQL